MQAAAASAVREANRSPSPQEQPHQKVRASPFLKWAGGKNQLLPQLDPFFPPPDAYARYIEPFLGGGAVFFHLQPAKAILSDLNEELINAYIVVREHLPRLTASLNKHDNTKDYYYELRDKDFSSPQSQVQRDVERASRLIYLNKWCYNGLYRVNSKGHFNVPRGSYKVPPRLFDEENLRNIALLLKRAVLRFGSYDEILRQAGPYDFVYLDPPYYPRSETANFTKYTQASFGLEDQVKLAGVLRKLHNRGALFMLSNHRAEFLEKRLYSDFKIQVATANRSINSKADKRTGVEELIVMNYSVLPGGEVRRLPPFQ